MLIKLGEIYNLINNESFKKLGNTKLTTVKDTWNLTKNIDKILKLGEKINKSYNDIVLKYGEKNDKDNYFIPNFLEDGSENPNVKLFLSEKEELFSIEEEVDILSININAFDDDTHLEVSDLMAIKFMITE